jgi:hypothetical protein
MSLGVVIKGAEGVVLTVDSRVTLLAQAAPGLPAGGAPLGQVPQLQQIAVNFDNATKLLTFGGNQTTKWIAAVTYGDAVIGTNPTNLRTAHSFIPEFEAELAKNPPASDRFTVGEFAQKLSDFFKIHWDKRMPANYQGAGMIFCVGGYDKNEHYGSIYTINIPRDPTPRVQSDKAFGIVIGGQGEIAARILRG